MNFWYNMQPYYDIENLNTYPNVNPAKEKGVSWYSWGMDFAGYYNSNGVLQYCYYGNQYTWNPAVWGYYPGWTMYWSGSCGDVSSDLQWWQDTWYTWGMSFSGYYNDAGVLQYCYYGNQYSWNPAVWGYYPGWTMYWSGSCGSYYFSYTIYYYYYYTFSGEW